MNWPVLALVTAEAVGLLFVARSIHASTRKPREEPAMFGRHLTCSGLAQPCGDTVPDDERLQAVGLCPDCWQLLRANCRVMSYRVASGEYTDYPRISENEGVVRQEQATAEGYVPRRPDDVLETAYTLRYMNDEEYHSWQATRRRDGAA